MLRLSFKILILLLVITSTIAIVWLLKFQEKVEENQLIDFQYLTRTHFSKVPGVKGAYWIRVWIPWGAVEKKEGVFDFSYVDKIIEGAQSQNLIVLITILPFAEWDQNKCHIGEEYYGNIPMPEGKTRMKVGKPCNMSAYKRFLRKLVERYDGDSVDDMLGLKYPVKYWEIMNEPGMNGSDPSGLKFFYGSSRDYLDILKASYEAIKEADPDAKVVMGGMAGMLKRFIDFWDPIMSEAKNYFDIANIHSIDTREDREDLYILEFKEFLKKHGAEKPIWVTEAQFDRLEKPVDKSMHPLIVKSAILALALGADKIFFISDNWKTGETFKVYETLVKMLNDFNKVEILELDYIRNKDKDSGITSIKGLFKFTGDNKTVYVAWGNINLTKHLKRTVKVIDIYGNEKIVNVKDVNLSNTPVYIQPISQG